MSSTSKDKAEAAAEVKVAAREYRAARASGDAKSAQQASARVTAAQVRAHRVL